MNIENLGLFIINKLRLDKFIQKDDSSVAYLRMMAPRADPDKGRINLWAKRVGVISVLILVGILLFIYCLTDESDESLLSDHKFVTRQDTSEELSLTVHGDSADGTWDKDYRFEIDTREFTKEEIKTLDAKAEAYIGDKLLGENTSTQSINKKLIFIKSIPQTDIKITWTYDDDYIKDSGDIKADAIPKGGTDTEVMAQTKWKNYKANYHFTLHLKEPVYTPTELAQKEAKKRIKKSIKDQSDKAVITLPDGYMYETPDKDKSYLPVYLVVAVILLLPVLWREKQKKSKQKRKEEMLLDHSGFINKFMLLLSAGLTVRYCVYRLTDEYEKGLSEGEKTHYVYEELCIAAKEMADGVSEAKAIEEFGKRCRLMPYLRFSSIISQNLKKGAEGILNILDKEAGDSLEERKQLALRLGETAGTKLLFPMMLMLGLVMAIIMVPAFMTM